MEDNEKQAAEEESKAEQLAKTLQKLNNELEDSML